VERQDDFESGVDWGEELGGREEFNAESQGGHRGHGEKMQIRVVGVARGRGRVRVAWRQRGGVLLRGGGRLIGC
jgi:hypothetical protein